MPTKQERIQKLKDQAAEYRQTAGAKEEAARKLEIEDRKIQADRNRKDETRAKITVGAALTLLQSNVYVPVVRAISSVLAPRDQAFLAQWCKSHEHDPDKSTFGARLADALSGAKSNEDHAETKAADDSGSAKATDEHSHPSSSTNQKPVTVVDDPVGNALKSILSGLTEGEFGLLGPDILNHASMDQCEVLEPWFATRAVVEVRATNPSILDPHDQAASDSLVQDSHDQSIRENAEVGRSGDFNEQKELDSGSPITGGDKNL